MTQGGTRSIHDGGVQHIFLGLKFTRSVFFGVKRAVAYFFRSPKKYVYCFGSYLRANFSFRVFVAISGSEKYSFKLFFSDVCSRKTVNIKKTIQCTLRYLSLVFFWVGNFDTRYFFGV